jgi:hypothetical protein
MNNEYCIFDWMMAFDIADIIKVLRDKKVQVEYVDRRKLRISGTNIMTRNFKDSSTFVETFARRFNRLKSWLDSGDYIYFVRHDAGIPTTDEDLDELTKAINGPF